MVLPSKEIFRHSKSFSQIKCNRLRPTCEACQVFQCPCIYGELIEPCALQCNITTDGVTDAVPKKRGPKTDVLEALLKRVDGLERRLKDEKTSQSPNADGDSDAAPEERQRGNTKPKRPQLDTTNVAYESAVYSPSPPRLLSLIWSHFRTKLTACSHPSPDVQPDVLLDTYFTRCHGKAYHILEESKTRQRIQSNQIPPYLLYAIYAVSARWASHTRAGNIC